MFGSTRLKQRFVCNVLCFVETIQRRLGSTVHARTPTKSAQLHAAHEDQPVLPNAVRSRACRISTHTTHRPRPSICDTTAPAKPSTLTEARQQAGDVEDVAVSPRCRVSQYTGCIHPLPTVEHGACSWLPTDQFHTGLSHPSRVFNVVLTRFTKKNVRFSRKSRNPQRFLYNFT